MIDYVLIVSPDEIKRFHLGVSCTKAFEGVRVDFADSYGNGHAKIMHDGRYDFVIVDKALDDYWGCDLIASTLQYPQRYIVADCSNKEFLQHHVFGQAADFLEPKYTNKQLLEKAYRLREYEISYEDL